MIFRPLPIIVASIVIAAPAVANYPECMRLCMLKQPFKECHEICKELGTGAPAAGTSAREAPVTPDAGTGSPAAAPKAAEARPPIPDVLKGRVCGTLHEKWEAVGDYIWAMYKPQESLYFPTEDRQTFRSGYYLPDKQRYCRGLVRITDDCRVSEHDFKCEFADE